MKNQSTPSLLTTLVIALASTVSSNAATLLTTSASAPTVNGEDVASLAWTDTATIKSFVDAGPRGQTFTTGLTNVFINSFSLNSNTGTLGERNNTFTLRVGTITAGVFSQIASTTVNQDIDTAAGNWNTFHFDGPVALSANTTYAVDVDMISSVDWPSNIPYYRYNRSNTAAGGNRYEGNNTTPTTVTQNTGHDMVFHVDLTAVPEPSTFGLAALGALMLLRRRRA